MTNIFSILSNIITHKKDDVISVEEDREYQFYLINRWLSMHSPKFASIVNDTTNRYWSCLTKDEMNKLLINSIPKSRFKRINYIKKSKKEKTKKEEDIEMLAKNLELSKREVSMYKEL